MGFTLELVKPPAECPPDYEPSHKGAPRFFSLLGDEMDIFVAVMVAAKILNRNQKTPSFPDWPPAGISDERAEDIWEYFNLPDPSEHHLTPAECQLWEEYVREAEQALATPSKTPGKVPSFKFEREAQEFVSLDDPSWHVTPGREATPPRLRT
jgi:hypothetical protein